MIPTQAADGLASGMEGRRMVRQYFGTDGIRGLANTPPMTAETALKVGMAAGKVLAQGGGHRLRAVIGKDTRLSGYMIENALMSGFTAVGVDVFQLGPMPTPAVAMLTRSLRADIGVMISASHNQFADNGIKLFEDARRASRVPRSATSSSPSARCRGTCASTGSGS
jgi:phosphomannomutase